MLCQNEELTVKVNRDVKQYEARNGTIQVAQIECADLDRVDAAYLKSLDQHLPLKSFLLNAVFITDVMKSVSLLYFTARPGTYAQICALSGFNCHLGLENCLYMPDMISRKKQLMPHLIDVVNKVVQE